MEQVEVTLDDISFTLWGYYTKAYVSKDYFEPNEPATFDLTEVYQGDANIIDYLTEYVLRELTDLALENLTN